MSDPINPSDTCECSHSAASHGFDYTECTTGHAASDPRDACPCAAFKLAQAGETFERNDGRTPAPAREVGRVTMPKALSGEGFWLAYGPDGARAAFPDELSALRFAVENSLSVSFQKWGELDV